MYVYMGVYMYVCMGVYKFVCMGVYICCTNALTYTITLTQSIKITPISIVHSLYIHTYIQTDRHTRRKIKEEEKEG